MINLPAGPDLDRLIAEKVMGWKPTYTHVSGNLVSYGDRVITKSHATVIQSKEDGSAKRIDFQPSRDIEHAWEVVEQLQKPTQNLILFRTESGTWIAGWQEGDTDLGFCSANHFDDHVLHGGEADTAPLAICRSALKAMPDG